MGGPGGGGPPGMGGPGGGRGGFEGGGRGGRGGPAWQGRPNAMAFGNNRRDPRNSYMASANFSLDNSVWDARTFSVTGANRREAVLRQSGAAASCSAARCESPACISASKRILFTFNLSSSATAPAPSPTRPRCRPRSNAPAISRKAAYTIYDPTTGSPFPGNRIPATRINSTSLALLDYFPNPNLPCAARNYQTSWTGSNNSHNLNSRISNVRIGGKDRLNFGLGYQGSNTRHPQSVPVHRYRLRHAASTPTWPGRTTSAPRSSTTCSYTFSRMRQAVLAVLRRPRERGGLGSASWAPRRTP